MITQKKHAKTVPNLVDFVNISNIGNVKLSASETIMKNHFISLDIIRIDN